MKIWILTGIFVGICNSQDTKWEIINGRRAMRPFNAIVAYRYNPYGTIIDRSSGRPIVTPAFVIERFYLQRLYKNIN